MKRQDIYNNIFSARALFVTGLLMMPSLLFNQSTEYRVLQFFFFLFLTLLSGKKINPLFTLLVIASIVFFNLIIPYGRVLFSFGLFKITSGALKAGIHRAVTFEALVMISKVSVRQDLQIPGAFGELLSDSFRIFSVMMSRKYRFSGKNIFSEIDNLMLELTDASFPASVTCARKTKGSGYIIIAITLLLSWLPFVRALF